MKTSVHRTIGQLEGILSMLKMSLNYADYDLWMPRTRQPNLDDFMPTGHLDVWWESGMSWQVESKDPCVSNGLHPKITHWRRISPPK